MRRVTIVRVLTYEGTEEWITKCLQASWVKGRRELLNGTITERFDRRECVTAAETSFLNDIERMRAEGE